MGKLLTKIEAGQGISLEKLDLSTGIVAFDNSDMEHPAPFIVAWPVLSANLKKGYREHDTGRVLRLIYVPQEGMREEWTLPCATNTIKFWSPNTFGSEGIQGVRITTPKAEFVSQVEPYIVEKAYSGKEEIANALEQMKHGHMDFYASWFR